MLDKKLKTNKRPVPNKDVQGGFFFKKHWASMDVYQAPQSNERENTPKIVNRPDLNLMFFSFIGKWLSHLRFKILGKNGDRSNN